MSIAVPTLTTDRLRLRPFDDGDAEDIWSLQSDAHVLEFWDSPAWTERSRIARFLERSRTMAEEDFGVRLAIDSAADGTFLGWISLHDWNQDYRTAGLGYCFTEASWGHGYATEAAAAFVGWAFEALDLNRVEAEADTRNAASGRVLEKLGFALEGTLRENCVVDGVVSDSWVYGLLRRDWVAV